MKRHPFLAIYCGLLIMLLGSCSTSTIRSDDEDDGIPTHARANALTREAATSRAKQVGNVNYTLWFGLEGQKGEYDGRAVIQFEVKPKAREFGREIFLDFEEGVIRSLVVNGSRWAEPQYDGHRIRLKLTDLIQGANRVEISFTHPYSQSGNGLHRFKDLADGEVYLYSNFEPYSAHRMFPCFDQPDLKASYELTVEAPGEWEVISNHRQREVTHFDGRTSWAFPPTPVLSTYLFALHAGPYHVWKADANGIPMRLFARKSMAQHVDHEEWFKVTRNGLDFYAVQFGYPYPFSKYDQVIVPDFNAGAMENPGAVTFSERFVYRTKVTADVRRRRADVILHEMAHMWFGDLVTMRWWNGLWLNESFATFMAAWAADKATDFGGSWLSFFTRDKRWGYWEDQLVTTHPIDVPVHNTDQAFANFDGITYGKGAAILKQLFYFLGEESFREGVQRYFQKHAFRNTSLNDFMKMLAEASGQNLSQWQRSWIQTAGVNSLRAEWACGTDPQSRKSRIQRFTLVQGGVDTSPLELRSHRTQIALFSSQKKGGELRLQQALPYSYSEGRTDVNELIGKPCPDLVFPNFQDFDYVKIELDPISLETVRTSLSALADPLTRQMIWHSLWEMVNDAKLKSQTYIEIALNHLSREREIQVLNAVLKTLASSAARKPSILKFLPSGQREEFSAKLEKFILAHLRKSPASSDLQLTWLQAFLEVAKSQESLGFVRGLMTGKASLAGLRIDQQRRWELLRPLTRNGVDDAKELVMAEQKKDVTDQGLKEAIAAESLIPDIKVKERWWEQILHPSPELPVAKLRESMGNFHILGQEELTRPWVPGYFDSLPVIAGSHDEEYAGDFTENMFPALCDPQIVQRTNQFLDSHPNLPFYVVKALKISRQEEERCVKAREKALSSAEL